MGEGHTFALWVVCESQRATWCGNQFSSFTMFAQGYSLRRRHLYPPNHLSDSWGTFEKKTWKVPPPPFPPPLSLLPLLLFLLIFLMLLGDEKFLASKKHNSSCSLLNVLILHQVNEKKYISIYCLLWIKLKFPIMKSFTTVKPRHKPLIP